MRMLRVSKHNNKYGCMLLASLGKVKGMSTRVTAYLVSITTAPLNRPPQPNPAYDLPKVSVRSVVV